VKDLEKQIAFTEDKLAEADKVNAIISEVCKENFKLFNKIEEISKVSAPSFADIVQRKRSASRTRIIDPQKTCALVIRPKGKSTHDETRKKLRNVVTLRNLPFRIKKFKNISNGGIVLEADTDDDTQIARTFAANLIFT
ncbi:hypothetical protein AVEN_163404-1, partial [Araneus ventricosus]